MGRHSRAPSFTRMVELFPPILPLKGKVDLDAEIDAYIDSIRRVRDSADVFVVASLKSPGGIQVSPLETAAMIQELLRVDACPAVVLRGLSRQSFLSTVATGISLGLKSMFVAWGDDISPYAGSANFRDFKSLAEALGEASRLRKRAGSAMALLAPLDLEGLESARGMSMAVSRVRAGADSLLCQPPTTDPGATYGRHALLLKNTGLGERALLNVFPFRDAKDARRCERLFGWKLSEEVFRAAGEGRDSLDELAKGVVARLRNEGAPGVYLSTRGDPDTARTLLG